VRHNIAWLADLFSYFFILFFSFFKFFFFFFFLPMGGARPTHQSVREQ
jgi:hypothetical protein